MRPIRSRKSKDLSSHILHCGLTPTVALLRQMESSDIDYQIQQLYGSMSGGGAQLRDENGRIVIAKYVPSGRQSTINNHPAHEKSQLNTVPADRIPQQDRQPHKEGPDIRHLTVPMEKREMVTDAVERVTDNVPSELKRKKQEVGNEEREVEEMGGMVKEIGCRERGMGEKSEIRKRQSLEFREELRMQIEEKKREREEERKKARQDEDEEEGDGEHHSSQTTRDDANQRRAVVVVSTREEKQQTQQQKEFMVEDGGEQTLNEDTVDPDTVIRNVSRRVSLPVPKALVVVAHISTTVHTNTLREGRS
ncbi:hypothetical protein BLNAU_19484 [Blattamonas nauphoetae]|uniref:Uncharacterized protein n=1 Tax=Blattamonas nauphoetae TaxID=2049346 RepID=A0ABQ9X1B9_9EUKA|nr:hypothetical protein BLNAU_19484 [Blattamonas nauphoetae]